MLPVDKILNNPTVKSLGIIITGIVIVVGVSIVIDKYYSAKKTRQDYLINQYKLKEYKDKMPDLKLSKI